MYSSIFILHSRQENGSCVVACVVLVNVGPFNRQIGTLGRNTAVRQIHCTDICMPVFRTDSLWLLMAYYGMLFECCSTTWISVEYLANRSNMPAFLTVIFGLFYKDFFLVSYSQVLRYMIYAFSYLFALFLRYKMRIQRLPIHILLSAPDVTCDFLHRQKRPQRPARTPCLRQEMSTDHPGIHRLQDEREKPECQPWGQLVSIVESGSHERLVFLILYPWPRLGLWSIGAIGVYGNPLAYSV